MMTAKDFRRIALCLEGAVEGAWGRQGCTRVLFARADEEAVGEARTLAWQQSAIAASSSPPRRPTSRRSGARPKR